VSTTIVNLFGRASGQNQVNQQKRLLRLSYSC